MLAIDTDRFDEVLQENYHDVIILRKAYTHVAPIVSNKSFQHYATDPRVAWSSNMFQTCWSCLELFQAAEGCRFTLLQIVVLDF